MAKNTKYEDLLSEVRAVMGLEVELFFRSCYKGIEAINDDAEKDCSLVLRTVKKRSFLQLEAAMEKESFLEIVSPADNEHARQRAVALCKVAFFLKRFESSFHKKDNEFYLDLSLSLMSLSEVCHRYMLNILSEGGTISRSLPAMAAEASVSALVFAQLASSYIIKEKI